jgi:REP element-mobilizing transposase RayT
MPDHVHLLLQTNDEALSSLVRRLKSTTAQALNIKIGRRGRFWSPGFHDHAIRREKDVRSVARYIIANPLRAGLVENVGDYPWWDAIWLES